MVNSAKIRGLELLLKSLLNKIPLELKFKTENDVK